MHDRNKVIQGLSGLVGWKQPFNPDLPVLDSDNLLTDSGRLFNSNPYVKLDYIKETQDYIDISDDNFNELLKDVEGSAITNVIDTVFDKPDFIDRQVLYQRTNNKVDLESGNAGFVGFKIETAIDKNIAFEISRVLLEFDGVGDIKLLLFNSAKSDPIQTKDISISSKFQEEALNWKIDNTNGFYKGDFYIGYIANGLTVTPYKRNYQSSNVKSCITHLHIEEGTFKNQSTEVLSDLDTWDSSDNTFGLNLDITVFDDFTDMIIQNKFLFSKAIQLQGQINFIDSYIASLRSNRNARIADDNINKLILELEGADELKKIGLRSKLGGEVSRIGKEIRKIQSGYFADGFLLNTLS
jgi:hypothetical protein